MVQRPAETSSTPAGISDYWLSLLLCMNILLQMIDDFTDVNEGEKELMKLWNLFITEKK